MTLKGRLKFFIGIIFVLLLVAVLVLYLNAQMSAVHSTKAFIRSDAIAVGTDYPGEIIKQNANLGDKVRKGETLFVVQSPQLQDLLNSGTVKAASLPFSIDSAHNVLLKATDDGVIQSINFRVGSFAPQGAVLATINTVSTLYVEAHYTLSPPDYARIQKGSNMDVTFPDDSRTAATVYDVSLASNGNAVDTVAKARLNHPDLSDFRFSPGTPVQATLKLTKKTWVQTVYDFFRNLIEPKTGRR